MSKESKEIKEKVRLLRQYVSKACCEHSSDRKAESVWRELEPLLKPEEQDALRWAATRIQYQGHEGELFYEEAKMLCEWDQAHNRFLFRCPTVEKVCNHMPPLRKNVIVVDIGKL